jgi:hypothetical protein
MAPDQGQLHRVFNRQIRLRPLLAVTFSLMIIAIAAFFSLPWLTAAIHWNTHRTTAVAGRRIDLPFLWSSNDYWSPSLTRPGPGLLTLSDSLEIHYDVTPGVSPERVRQAWRSTVGLTRHLDRRAKPEGGTDAEALRKLGARLEKRDLYDLEPGWECYESPGLPRLSIIWLNCISPDSRYSFRYWGRASHVSDVKRIAEQLR